MLLSQLGFYSLILGLLLSLILLFVSYKNLIKKDNNLTNNIYYISFLQFF